METKKYKKISEDQLEVTTVLTTENKIVYNKKDLEETKAITDELLSQFN